MTSDNYTLRYFNFRGRAEPIRWILKAANVDYKEDFIERPDWPKRKPSKHKFLATFID